MSKDPVVLSELRHERECELARRVREHEIAEEVERVWCEVDAGEHDDEIANSSCIDTGNMARVAYQATFLRNHLEQGKSAMKAIDDSRIDIGALRDFDVQLTDYVETVAADRVDGR